MNSKIITQKVQLSSKDDARGFHDPTGTPLHCDCKRGLGFLNQFPPIAGVHMVECDRGAASKERGCRAVTFFDDHGRTIKTIRPGTTEHADFHKALERIKHMPSDMHKLTALEQLVRRLRLPDSIRRN
jgi:hypothetical protein